MIHHYTSRHGENHRALVEGLTLIDQPSASDVEPYIGDFENKLDSINV